jgi:hypothetical protein
VGSLFQTEGGRPGWNGYGYMSLPLRVRARGGDLLCHDFCRRALGRFAVLVKKTQEVNLTSGAEAPLLWVAQMSELKL